MHGQTLIKFKERCRRYLYRILFKFHLKTLPPAQNMWPASNGSIHNECLMNWKGTGAICALNYRITEGSPRSVLHLPKSPMIKCKLTENFHIKFQWGVCGSVCYGIHKRPFTNLHKFTVHGTVHCWMCILHNQRDATYTTFFIIISALHVSGGFSAHHQELIKLYVQPWVLLFFPAVYRRPCRVPSTPAVDSRKA
jgi:hypothetical protein